MTATRRDFLILGAAAGASLLVPIGAAPAETLHPGPFLEIDAAGAVTIWVSRGEMGQGVRTSLPMLVAEELDADWSRIRVRQAPLDARFGEQRTGGSLSIRELWEPLRRAGATARAMLVGAAATAWDVPAERLRTESGFVHETGGVRRASYGELAALAATLPVPREVPLKDAKDFRIIGTSRRRLDGIDLVTGRARFGIDVHVPGMLYATIVRCPVIGGRPRRFDAQAARRMAGVRDVFAIEPPAGEWLLQWSSGVAVVADSTWAALRAREALAIEWDEGPHGALDQAAIETSLREHLDRPGLLVHRRGDVAAPNGVAITADYQLPYLAHAPLEPMNCVVSVERDRCRVIAPVQLPQSARTIAARVSGLDPSRVEVEITLMGGGFGRRLYADYVGEAALISKRTRTPIQLVWTRSDDMQHGFYRPLSHHRLRASVRGGCVVSWSHRISGPSRRAMRGRDVEKPEESETYAAIEMPYDVPAVTVDYHHVYVPLPCGPWRGVAYSQTGFVIESFIDELAHACGADPVAFRLAQLPPRMAAALRHAVARAGPWRARRGRGRGVAVTVDHGSVVAHVAEVTVRRDAIRVDRFVSAIDCGQVVNPDHVRAQVEGGIVFALSAALKGEITLRNGRVEQATYADYDVVRMREMPRVEVHILGGSGDPGGVGEPPVPGVAPAVANAVFDATGRRLRRLPLQREWRRSR